MTRPDFSEYLFRKGYNCAQSVFGAFHDILGFTLEDATRLVSPMGAGFGKMREVCGAVSGMTLVFGYLKGYSDSTATTEKIEVYKKEKELLENFKKEMGSIICRDMLNLKVGEDLDEPAIRDENYYKSRPCIKACRTAAYILTNEFNIEEYNEDT